MQISLSSGKEGAQPRERSATAKLFFVLAIGLLLSIPLMMVFLIVYDRSSLDAAARASIVEGWGGPQVVSGPVLSIPYHRTIEETAVENGQSIKRTHVVTGELTLAPQSMTLDTKLKPERRRRAIYNAVVYEASQAGNAKFVFPPNLDKLNLRVDELEFDHAYLRFGLSDPRGLVGDRPKVSVAGHQLELEPGKGLPDTSGSGFFGWIDASTLRAAPIAVDFAYDFRGSNSLSFAPNAGDLVWTVESSWPSPGFGGRYLPKAHRIGPDGFEASYQFGNLAVGRPLVQVAEPDRYYSSQSSAVVELTQGLDVYSQVNRAVKYGFLFIGLTFLVFLMFDVVGGVHVSSAQYLLVGVALILFFVLLLAFAEIIGFALAYVLAALAIIGLNAAYSAAILKGWRRALLIGALLTGLYAALYVLLGLEAYALLIGSLLIFIALASAMYATRRLDWSAKLPI